MVTEEKWSKVKTCTASHPEAPLIAGKSRQAVVANNNEVDIFDICSCLYMSVRHYLCKETQEQEVWCEQQ